MACFGEYESRDEVSVGPVTAVYLATRAGSAEPPAFVVKVLDLSRMVTEVKDPATFVTRFLAAAEVQKRAAKSSAHWAPVHSMGNCPDGAYYVTDRFEHSLHRLIRGHAAVSHARLHSLISQIARGLIDLRTNQRRAHGNLKACNILLRNNRLELPGNVLLADPLPETLESESHSVADVECVGKLLYWLVTGREFTFRTPLPIEDTPEWRKLGSAGAKWRWLCDRMLDPHPPADLSPQWVADQLGRMRSRRPPLWIAAATAVVAALAIATPRAIHFVRNAHQNTIAGTPQIAVARPIGDGTIVSKPPVIEPERSKVDVLHGFMNARNNAAEFDLHVTPQFRTDAGQQLMILGVSASSDCYLMVLTRDSQDQITLLVPNADLDAPALAAGQTLQLPSRGSFVLAPPWGTTTIKVIGTKKRIELVGATGPMLFTGITALRVAGANKQGNELSEILAPSDWAAADAEFVTSASGLPSENGTPAGDAHAPTH
jgi:hypothetical protein